MSGTMPPQEGFFSNFWVQKNVRKYSTLGVSLGVLIPFAAVYTYDTYKKYGAPYASFAL